MKKRVLKQAFTTGGVFLGHFIAEDAAQGRHRIWPNRTDMADDGCGGQMKIRVKTVKWS